MVPGRFCWSSWWVAADASGGPGKVVTDVTAARARKVMGFGATLRSVRNARCDGKGRRTVAEIAAVGRAKSRLRANIAANIVPVVARTRNSLVPPSAFRVGKPPGRLELPAKISELPQPLQTIAGIAVELLWLAAVRTQSISDVRPGQALPHGGDEDFTIERFLENRGGSQ